MLTAAATLSTQYSALEGDVEKQNVLRMVLASITLRTDAMMLEIASGRLIAMLLDGTADQKGPAQPPGAADGALFPDTLVVAHRIEIIAGRFAAY
nr:hypothetical protein [uncultured Shinella sp.]